MRNFKISKNIDYLIIVMMIVHLVFLKFIGLERTGNKLLLVLILITVLKHFYTFIKNSYSILFLCGIGILLFINVLVLGGSLDNIKSNFVMLLYPILSVLFVGYFLNRYPDKFQMMMREGFWWINGYFLANVVVLCLQLQGDGFMVGINAAGTENPMYEDLIAGLLGYSGTHQLSIFFVFVILYNLTYWKYIVNRPMKGILFVYIISSTIFTFFISTQNLNQAYIFLLLLSFLIYAISLGVDGRKMKLPWKIVTKYIGIIVCVLVFVVLLYHNNDVVKQFIDENLFDKIDMAMDAMEMGLAANGSDERFAMILYGLQNYNGWNFGMGLGNYFIFQEGALGFAHFGQASIGTLICLCGIWFVIMWLLFYVYIVNKMLYKKMSFLGFLLILVYYIFLGVYCQVAYDNIVALWGIIALLPIGFAMEEKRRRQEERVENGDQQ